MAIDLKRLVVRAQHGDAAAFDQLVRRFQDRAVAYARSILCDPSAAEDAAQDAFLQAWHDLPCLNEPAAFPVWLRRIVFKYCDRIRRAQRLSVVSLDAAFYVAGGPEPRVVAERAHDAARIRTALGTLPEREREAALLYYLGGRDLAEIAGFLEVPRTTVKNRLHAARQRLRKELWEMAEEVLAHEKPSRDEAFAGRVITQILEEFNQQMRADPHAADRSLLTRGREALFAALATPGPLDWEIVRAGFGLLLRQKEHKAIASLMMRYLAQPLDDSHTAWAYFHLSNSIACGGEAAGAVLAHEVFERWLPGRHPRLSKELPFYPAQDAAESAAYGEGDVLLLSLGKSIEFATAWNGVWREDDYLAKVDAALERVPPTPGNQWPRFMCLRAACTVCESSHKFDRAQGYVDRMYAVAAEPAGEETPDVWKARALEQEIGVRRRRGDADGAMAKAQEMADLLASTDAPWARGERHNLAHQYWWGGRHDLALPLLERNLATGGHTSWGYFVHAAVLWQVSQDRARTLGLLRDAAARSDRDLTPEFQHQREFADVQDDPEFAEAIRQLK